ncbi:MAG: hypothetical protein JWO67_6075 [Streptosporangiaceae bacterium]|nr:hypothetical protein [Streptosporangiaceae bacterium]
MRAVIAEDSLLLRVGLVKVLEMAGFEIAAEVGDAEALLAAVEEHRPGPALVDVRMPPGFTDEGVRAALVIRKQWPQTAVVLLSQYVEERYAADLLTANTSGVGYLLKQRVADVQQRPHEGLRSPFLPGQPMSPNDDMPCWSPAPATCRCR